SGCTQPLERQLTRLGVRSENVVETADLHTLAARTTLAGGSLCDHGFNDRRDLDKVQLTVQEGLHCNLIGAIENGRLQPTGPSGGLRQGEAAELVVIGGP